MPEGAQTFGAIAEWHTSVVVTVRKDKDGEFVETRLNRIRGDNHTLGISRPCEYARHAEFPLENLYQPPPSTQTTPQSFSNSNAFQPQPSPQRLQMPPEINPNDSWIPALSPGAWQQPQQPIEQQQPQQLIQQKQPQHAHQAFPQQLSQPTPLNGFSSSDHKARADSNQPWSPAMDRLSHPTTAQRALSQSEMSAHTESPSIANSLDDSAALLDYSASFEDLLVDLHIVGVAEVGLQLTVSARGSPHQLKTLCRFQWQRIETIVDSDGTHRCVAKKATNQEGTLYIVQDSDTECVIRVVAAQNKSEKSKQLVFADTWAPVVRKPSFKHAVPRTFSKDSESKSRRNAVSAILHEPTEDGAELEPLISSKKENCTHALLQLILSSHFLFSKMPPEHLESIICASKKKDVSKGQTLVKRGDPAQHLYIIETGEYDVLPDEHHGTRPSTTLVGGTIFGEASLMYQCKRAVSVVAKTGGTVWELANVDFYQALRDHMQTSARCKVKRFLMTLPMFRYLTERSMETLVSLCHIVTHPAGTTVARKTHRSGIFFVQAGILDIVVNGTKMRSLQAGKFFGESCLNIPGAGHQQVHEISSGDAMAQTDVSLLLIHPEELLLQLPAIVPIFWKAHILEALRRLPAFEDLEQNDLGAVPEPIRAERVHVSHSADVCGHVERVLHGDHARRGGGLRAAQSAGAGGVSECGQLDREHVAAEPHSEHAVGGGALELLHVFGAQQAALRGAAQGGIGQAQHKAAHEPPNALMHAVLLHQGPGEHYADADIPARASGTDVRAAQLDLFIILDGGVEVVEPNQGSIVQHLHSGAYFGKEGFFKSLPSKVTIRVTSQLHVRVLDHGNNPDLQKYLWGCEEHRKVQLLQQKISTSDLHFLRVIGTGRLSEVFLVKSRISGNSLAVKRISLAKLALAKQEKKLENEQEILTAMNHPFIVRYVTAFSDEHYHYLVMEPCLGGELFAYLAKSKDKRFSAGVAKFYLANLVCALEYLHNRNIMHRDLKPENLLLGDDGYLKLVDFGSAHNGRSRNADVARTLCGTSDYLAPEMLTLKGHRMNVDFWGLGCLAYELVVGSPPFGSCLEVGHNEVYKQILANKKNVPTFTVDTDAMDLIDKLLVLDPAQRLGAGPSGWSAVKAHTWFKKMDWEALQHKRIRAPVIPIVNDQYDTGNFAEFSSSCTNNLCM
eukprot:CAMPEP_0198203040 /NCGR_PEP_ID=MMETSP1445-20131203/6286_1 /TAXON_ID=36898 /ORGANISM="Pyramimonas sp., Strain CCMP2087" /LENGTH=1184 /DNA_ID=CAMNT_0043874253 /DNA_START=169 /DNA_END=3723 /DNA_ORIENTATION=-